MTPRPGGDLNRPLNRLYHDCTKTSSSCLSTLKAVLASRAHQRDCTGKSHQRVPAGRQEGSGLERDSTRLPMDVRIPSLQGVNGIRHGRLCAPRHEWLADSSTSRRLSPPCKEWDARPDLASAGIAPRPPRAPGDCVRAVRDTLGCVAAVRNVRHLQLSSKMRMQTSCGRPRMGSTHASASRGTDALLAPIRKASRLAEERGVVTSATPRRD